MILFKSNKSLLVYYFSGVYKMKYKKLMFILVLVIFLFGAASVCASEDNSTIGLSQADTGEMISLEEDKLIGQTENDELISEGTSGTFAELQANITAAKQGSTLTLTKNYERESDFDVEGIIIDKSITIDGNGFKIDAQGNSRIFKITADVVTLKNIIFANGKTTENGVAVLFEKSGTVTNCNFTNNNNGGSAVFFVGKGQVTNCNFADNYASYGAAIYFSDFGNVTNCNFTDNIATKDGGAVYFQDVGVVRNCNFIKSASKNNGGAVLFEKSATLTNCNFTDSTASNSGGAVYFLSDAVVSNCSFADNTAGEYGGAVYFFSYGDMTNCNFNNNTAKMGNAIYTNSNHCTVSECDFTNNPITEGAIHSVTGDITLSDNIFSADDVIQGRNFTEIQKLIDTANDGDEIIIDGLYAGFGIPITITKSLTLTGQNNATLDAKKLSKILHITANNVIIKNIQFTNGKTTGNGGAVFFDKLGTVENCNFTNNEVTGEKSSGGAIYFNGAGNVINSIFTANRAARNGGAVYVEAQSVNNNFSSEFYNNYAGQSGGAIFFHNLVQNNSFESIFKDNYAGYGGGMFFSKGANANRFSSDFINNTAKSCGGAMFFYSTTDQNNFTGRFINNSALGQIDPANGNGGAITFKNVSANSIFNSDFINNTASLNGGAVNYRETPKNIIFNANFTNNAAQRGGAVNFFKTFEDVIFNGEIFGNSAENGGALAAGYGTVKDISFKNNHANNGGAVYFAGSGLTVNCNFTNNSASRNGGAVYISEKGNVVNCSFADNSAAHDGGAVYSKFGTVENSNFTGNNASNNGGAVSLSYPSNVANCHFADNSAKNGGALYFLNDNDNVINCSFVSNRATTRGGAVFFMTKQDVNATNCYFEGNSAPEGGAIFCYSWAVTADSVVLKTDSDTTNNTLILSPKLDVHDFYSVYGSGENLTFNLTTHMGMPITDGNISMIIYFKDNQRAVANYTCLSGKDWTVDLPVGFYYALINTDYEDFEPLIRTIEITMPDVQFYINVTSITTNNRTVNITAKSDIGKNLLWDGKLLFILPNGTKINATYGANGTWWAEYAFADCGEYNISASYVGLDDVAVNNGTVTIYKADSTITLDNIVLDYDDSKNVTVTTTGALEITANIDSANVTVINKFTIPISGLCAGNHTLTVTTIADNNHNPVTKEVNITVNKLSTEIILANETLDLKVGDEVPVLVNLTPAGAGNLTFTSSDEDLVFVEDNVTIVANSQGQAIITVSFAGNENYTAAENKTITVNVALNDASVSVENDTLNLKVDETCKINATINPDTIMLHIKYTSGNESVATVDENGIVTAVGEGRTIITLEVGDDEIYAKNSTTVTVTVSKIPTEINIENTTVYMNVNDELSVGATLTPSDAGNVTYASSNSSVVTVDTKGNVKAVGTGKASINVSFAGYDKYEAAESKNVTVTVTKVETSIDVDVDSVEMKVGDNAKINATLSPADAGELDYTSSDVSVVSVNDIGEVTAVGDGTAVITVRFAGDDKYAPVSKNVTVTVSKKASKFAELIIVKNNATLILSDENGNPISGANISYTINGVSNDTVSDANGSFMIIGEAGAEILVSYAGNDVYLASNITINMLAQRQSTVIVGEDFTQYACDYYVGEKGNNFTVQLTDADGKSLANKTVYIGYNGVTLNRTTDANGYANIQINLKNAGLYTFVVVFLDDNNYNASMKVFKVTINKKTTSISASAKTFKASAKTKKYTVTLKTIKGASIDGKTYLEAGKKVTLKINGKTYTAKTNAKCQATFSLKITKKGKFTAVIKYAGDNTYKASSKKVKITIK